jgi:hypothetical protein
MYGPAVRSKMEFQEDERESCINVFGLSSGAIVLRAMMGIRAHPGLTSGKTSLGHHGTQSLGCAGQTVRPSLHSISQTSVGTCRTDLLSDV